MLLNTSFNVQEPIVCAPCDAALTYSRTKIEAMVLENHLVVRTLDGYPPADGP